MQKRRSDKRSIQFYDVALNDDFPVAFLYPTLKENNLSNLHHHNSFEIGLCLEGSGAFFIENKAITFHVGDISFIYPNQPHIAQSPNELPSRWIFMNVDVDRLFYQNGSILNKLMERRYLTPRIVHPSHCPELAQIAQFIVDEFQKKESDHQLAIKELLVVFLLKLLRLRHDENDEPTMESNEYFSIMPALSYITQNYQRDISIQDLAHACNFSQTHFRVLFRTAMGRNPKEYLSYVRLKMARTLLRSTDNSILNIAQSVGYDSISAFNRTFYSMYGQTPSAYRHQEQQA